MAHGKVRPHTRQSRQKIAVYHDLYSHYSLQYNRNKTTTPFGNNATVIFFHVCWLMATLCCAVDGTTHEKIDCTVWFCAFLAGSSSIIVIVIIIIIKTYPTVAGARINPTGNEPDRESQYPSRPRRLSPATTQLRIQCQNQQKSTTTEMKDRDCSWSGQAWMEE